MNSEKAIEIAKAYIKRYGLSGVVSGRPEESVQFYETFQGSEGSVWLVRSTYVLFGSEETTLLVVLDGTQQVDHIITEHGKRYIHLEGIDSE